MATTKLRRRAAFFGKCILLLAFMPRFIGHVSEAQIQVDFLWIIQNSGSMSDNQQVLAAATSEFVRQLRLTSIDWRVGVAYTDSDRPLLAGTCPGAPGPGRGVICPFTADSALFLNGSANASYTRPGTCGNGIERGFGSALAAIDTFLRGSGCLPGGSCTLRSGARLVIIYVTDTGEQTFSPPPGQPDTSVASWMNFFRDYDLVTPGLQTAQVHGFLCPLRPPLGNCSDNLMDPNLFERYSELIRRMNGVEASIRSADLPMIPTRIAQILSASVSSAEPEASQTRLTFWLYQSYPNPFNPSTTIRFSLPHSDFVSLVVFDILGEQIKTLVSENVSAGTHQIEWHAESTPSGIYFCRLNAGAFSQTKKLVLLK